MTTAAVGASFGTLALTDGLVNGAEMALMLFGVVLPVLFALLIEVFIDMMGD